MEQEDKELLLKDLCARLPYGVKIKTEYCTKATLISIRKNISYGSNKDLLVTYDISGEENPFQTDERIRTISEIKPYLFPFSSMTEKQEREYLDTCNGCCEYYWTTETFDWLNANHFDYRDLIDKKLAIDATNLNIY